MDGGHPRGNLEAVAYRVNLCIPPYWVRRPLLLARNGLDVVCPDGMIGIFHIVTGGGEGERQLTVLACHY